MSATNAPTVLLEQGLPQRLEPERRILPCADSNETPSHCKQSRSGLPAAKPAHESLHDAVIALRRQHNRRKAELPCGLFNAGMRYKYRRVLKMRAPCVAEHSQHVFEPVAAC